MILVPIDTFKTTMQTQGKHGVGILMDRVKAYGPGSLWWGAWATALSNFVGSFPWFATVSAVHFWQGVNTSAGLMALSWIDTV